jgi:hypothetical protein
MGVRIRVVIPSTSAVNDTINPEDFKARLVKLSETESSFDVQINLF